MDLFTQVKMAVSVKEAAEYYGLEVKRGSMVCCPFHNDRTPSMKLNEDYFYCFGCGATGDVIDLVAKLFNLSSYDAAKKLADDFGIDPDNPPAAAALRKTKYPLAKTFQNETLHCQRILCDYLHLLEHWKMQYAPKTPEDTLDDRFVEACQMLDCIEDLNRYFNLCGAGGSCENCGYASKGRHDRPAGRTPEKDGKGGGCP